MSSLERSGDLRNTLRWDDLSIDHWAAIAKLLTAISDYISFRCVCHTWRSAATFKNFDTEFPRVPWLMYACEKAADKRNLGVDVTIITYFLDLETKNIKILNFPPPDGIPYLSSSGWILHGSASLDISLIHFLRRRQKIMLPGLDTFPPFGRQDGIIYHFQYNYFISKMVLSGSPTIESDFVVMVIWGHNNRWAFCRPGNSSWTLMDSWDVSFCDILYHNRKLYAVDAQYRVVECDVHGPNPIELRQVSTLPVFDNVVRYVGFSEFIYLAVAPSSGKFLIVFRHFLYYKPLGIQIFEFELMDGSYREIQDMGNRTLFLGLNTSICLDLSALSILEPNCIYITDQHARYEVSGTGVYKLSTMRYEYLLEASLGTFFCRLLG